MTTFTLAQLPAMTGRTVVVTGANSGIGRAAARAPASCSPSGIPPRAKPPPRP
ncbi:hypothetical protein [Micromonospora carbonacea]